MDTLNPATLLSGRYRQEQIPDLTGRTAIVTGGSAGIGYYDALALARAGASVVLVSASEDNGKKAVEDMTAYLAQHEPNGKGSVRWVGCQLADLRDVDRASKELAKLDRLDILINNAGIGQSPWAMTKDGLESHFEINNLAPWVMTLRLLPLMRKTTEKAPKASVRIVMQSSELHRMAPSDTTYTSKEEINQERDGTVIYGQTKLGMVLFAKQLAKRERLNEANILITSVHPGTVNTEIQKSWSESYGLLGQATEAVMRLVGKSPAEGAEASLWAATCTDINAGNMHEYQGNYYSEAYGKQGKESSQAMNPVLGDRFWELCQKLSQEILGEDVSKSV